MDGARGAVNRAIPLGLYVHLPWCVRKCPYCDFNSHAPRGTPPFAAYVDALLADLDADMDECADALRGRGVETVFFGGGTPSLFAPAQIARLLRGIRTRLALAADAEITLEANPGAVERGNFAALRAAGINRLSLGAQSFDDTCLAALGRIHRNTDTLAAFAEARTAGFDNINLDLMYALPGQDARRRGTFRPAGSRRSAAAAVEAAGARTAAAAAWPFPRGVHGAAGELPHLAGPGDRRADAAVRAAVERGTRPAH